MADSVEKAESRSFPEIRLNGSEIFGITWLPLQINYGHLGYTRPCIMRAPASLSRNEAYGAGKIAPCPQTDFFNRIGPEPDILWSLGPGRCSADVLGRADSYIA